MGEKILYQPLTSWDRVTVVLYRGGILCSTVFISVMAYMLFMGEAKAILPLAAALYITTGVSVFFIHLYISQYKKSLMKLYIISLLSVIVLYLITRGEPAAAFAGRPFGALFFLPLSLCLGFITAKEAFCFKLMEGYVLAFLMPAYLLITGMGAPRDFQVYGLAFIAALLILFTLRKIFMPLHADIGDKSAYK
jgi:uncharacterized integral membrane protein